MNNKQYFAAGHYLSEWPEELCFDEIIVSLQQESRGDQIIACEVYELYPSPDVADFILEMVHDLERMF